MIISLSWVGTWLLWRIRLGEVQLTRALLCPGMFFSDPFLPGTTFTFLAHWQIQINVSHPHETLLLDNFIHSHLLLSSVSIFNSAMFFGNLMPTLVPWPHLKTLLTWEHKWCYLQSSETFSSNDIYWQTTNTTTLPFIMVILHCQLKFTPLQPLVFSRTFFLKLLILPGINYL